MPLNQTVTIAQALASSASSLLVLDTAANIAAALPNPGLLARVTSFSLMAAGTLGAADAEKLAGLGSRFQLNSFPLTVQDTVAAMMLPANAGGLALATTRGIVDAAFNLLGAPASDFTHIAFVTLVGVPTLSMSQFGRLEALPGFTVQAGSHLALQDALSAFVPVLSAHAAWFAAPCTLSVRLDGSQIGAAGVAALANLVNAGKAITFVPGTGDTTLNVTAAAHDLASGAASLNLLSASAGLHITVSNDGSAVTAADAVTLSGISGFSAATHTLYVADTGAAVTLQAAGSLFTLGFPEILVTSGNFIGTAAQLLNPVLQLSSGATVAMIGTATQTAAQAQALSVLPGFALVNGAALTISDTIAHILANAAATSVATSIVVTDSEMVSAANLTILALVAQAHPGHFSMNGNSVTVSDTAANLLALPTQAAALAIAFVVNANAIVSAADFVTLRDVLQVTIGSNALTVQDTAVHLLALTGSLSEASACVLSGAATVTVANAVILSNEPGFSTNGYALTIADNAANLLAMPAPLQNVAAGFTLANAQIVSADQLAGLVGLGTKFSTGGHALTVSGSAADLLGLTAPELHFVSAEILNQNATVTASVAQSLVARGGFSVGSGATLIVQDSAASILGMQAGVLGVVGVEELPAGPVTLTASQANGLSALAHFSAFGSTITVSDTVAALQAPVVGAGWANVATYTNVVDTAANIANAAGVALLQGATAVTMAGNATVTAFQASELASIPNFAKGGFALTVSDGAVAIVQNEHAIMQVATTAVVTDSGPVSASQAETLSLLSAAGKLVFQGSDQLAVSDTYAALVAAGNTAGVALANSIVVTDIAANLAVAASNNWGNKVPSYVLTGNAVLSGAQALALAGLGSHFHLSGYTLSVQDTAANVIAATSSLVSLGISAAVVDAATAIGGNVSALTALGTSLTSISVTGAAILTASDAAALAPLAGKLTGAAMNVVDTAADIQGNLAALVTLGAHVSIVVHDSAALIGPDATMFATLGAALSVTLSDSAPVLAATAAALLPLASHMPAGTALAITDTAAAITAVSAALVSLTGALGTLTLMGGPGVTVAQADALLPLDAHLGAGVMLAVTGNAAAISGSLAQLQHLSADNRLASVTDTADTALAVTSASAALNTIGAQVSVSDTQANILSSIAGLAQVTGLTAITVSGSPNPIFNLTINQYTADHAILSLVTNPYAITITDTAALIEADLASANPVIASIPGLQSIATQGNAPLVLSQAVAMMPAVTALLPHLLSPLQVTGVDLAHLSAVQALNPTSVTLQDTTAHIQADLASATPAIVADLLVIQSITATGGTTITLTAAQAEALHVDGGSGSVFSLMSGVGLIVTQALVSDVATLHQLGLPPVSISVSDTAAAITAALINPASALLISPGTIVTLQVNNLSPIVLTQVQDLAAGVNDNSQDALTKLSGAVLDVTGVDTSHLAAVEGGAKAPAQVSVSDTAANISGALQTLLTDLPNLGPITVGSGTVTLTYAQATTAGVADGAHSLISLLSNPAYAVTGATIGQVAALAALYQPPASIAVSDSTAALAADLTASFSQWAAHVSAVTVAGGTLTLTDVQAEIINTNGRYANLGELGTGQIVDITGVPISDLATFAGYATSLASGVTLHLEVADTALALATGSSVLTQEAAFVNTVTLTGAGGTLTAAQLTTVASIPGLASAGIHVPVTDLAASIAGLGLPAIALAGAVTVADSTGNVQSVLDTLQNSFHGNITINLNGVPPYLFVSPTTYAADQATIDAISNQHCMIVTGNASDIAGIEPQLVADAHVLQVHLNDSAFNVVSNLPAIAALGNLVFVDLTDNTIPAYLAQALAMQNLPNLFVMAVVTDTGSQIAAMAESGAAAATFLMAHGAQLTGNSNVTLVDATALASLGGSFNLNGYVLNVWDTAAHLTQPGAAASLAALVSASLVTGIYLKATNDAVTLTAATAIALLNIPGLHVNNPDLTVNTLTVADTAAHLDGVHAALQTDSSSIAHIVVNASATVGYATLTDLQALGAIAGSGVALTLSDSAANILTASAATGVSVQASAWNLNANVSISAGNALTLAALPGFSAGSYTLTVALPSDTAVSVIQANNLANLGPALHVTGHNFTIGGSVASLTGLSAGGASVAHVSLTDTLADIATLSSTSPLLTGTVTVSDSETLSAAQASSFLTLLRTAAVPPINITFASAETVTDTMAGLQALTTNNPIWVWTVASGLQANFALTAQDTASTLSSSSNTAFLDTLSHQVLLADSTVTAAAASTMASLTHFSTGGHLLTVNDSASNLLASANSAGVAIASLVHLNAAATVSAADAETLLQISTFHLTQPLTVSDNSANLLDGTLSGLIAGHSQVSVSLAGAETLDAQTAAALVSLQGFSDTTDMHIVDSSSYLLAASATPAETMAASVSLDGNETVSANTVLRLSEVPHFVTTGGTLTLASNDFANAPTLKAIADMGSHFVEGGHSLFLTQNDLALTPTELTAIQADGYQANGHVISAVLVNASATDIAGVMSLTATGVAGSTVNVYNSTGSLVSATHETNAGFTVTAPEPASGSVFSITETVSGVESAPIVVLDAGALESAVTAALTSFSIGGAIQVDVGKYISLYTAGASLPNAPALVYDPTAHTISLDIPNTAPVTLITLGASTSPASLDATEILVKHHS